jgi:hypothetical protein
MIGGSPSELNHSDNMDLFEVFIRPERTRNCDLCLFGVCNHEIDEDSALFLWCTTWDHEVEASGQTRGVPGADLHGSGKQAKGYGVA